MEREKHDKANDLKEKITHVKSNLLNLNQLFESFLKSHKQDSNERKIELKYYNENSFIPQDLSKFILAQVKFALKEELEQLEKEYKSL